MSSQANLSISCVELNTIDYSVLKVATGLLEKMSVQVDLLAQGDTSGNILVVDVDSEPGKQFYQQFNPSRAHTLLLLSSDALNDNRNLILRKPMRVQTLKDVLYDIHLESAPKKKAELEVKADVNAPVKQFDPHNVLFFLLLKAMEEKQVLQIFCHPYSPLFVHAEQGIVATSSSRDVLRKITHSLTDIKSTKLSAADFEVLAKGQLIMPLKNLLWSASLYGSQGQIIPLHSLDVPVRLKAWPNLSRLDFDPEHMKIASLMAAQAMSLKQLAERTKLPLATVIGFYNAVFIMGLVLINPNKSSSQHASAPVEPEKMGLFSKIAQRLKLATQ